jgi:hypothetical protein
LVPVLGCDTGQRVVPGWGSIQLSSPVAGDDHTGSSLIDDAPGILGREYSLGHDGVARNGTNLERHRRSIFLFRRLVRLRWKKHALGHYFYLKGS